jgi:signal transduction histidine kinase
MSLSTPPKLSHSTRDPLSSATRRWILFWNIESYVVLVVTIVIAWLDTRLTLQQHLITTILVVIWGVWYWVFIVRYARWVKRIPVLVISYVASIAVATILSWIHPAFLAILFSYFGLTFGIFTIRIAIPMIILLTIILIFRFIDFNTNSGNILSIIFGFLGYSILAIVLGWYYYSITSENRQKRRMIEELQATRDELAQAERQAGILQERQRLAGEIHDTLAQGFTSIILHLEAAEPQLETDPSQAHQHLIQARQTARENLEEARRVLWALRPEVLEHEPISQAIQRITQRWSEEHHIPADFTITGEAFPLPSEFEITLLRATQEALANVRKHAGAKKVNITISFMEDEVILDVHDDGRGFDMKHLGIENDQEDKGFGLRNMQARVEQLGGAFTIESAPGEGATLVVDLPLAEKAVKS